MDNQTENGPVNRTIVTTINRTIASPTALRLQDHYVIFYVNAARLLVQVQHYYFKPSYGMRFQRAFTACNCV